MNSDEAPTLRVTNANLQIAVAVWNQGARCGGALQGTSASRGTSDGKCAYVRSRIRTSDAVAHTTTDGRHAGANGPHWSAIPHLVRVWLAHLGAGQFLQVGSHSIAVRSQWAAVRGSASWLCLRACSSKQLLQKCETRNGRCFL